MAMVRPARSTPPYALIVFIFLWIVSTGLAAFFYVQGGKQVAEAKADQDLLAAIASRGERGSAGAVATLQENATAYRAASGTKLTVVGEAVREIDALKSKIGGAGGVNDLVKTEKGVIDQALSDARVGADVHTLLAALKVAADNAKTQGDKAAQLEKNLRSAQLAYDQAVAEKDKAVASQKRMADDRSDELKKKDGEITALHAEQDAGNKTHNDKVAGLQRDFELQLRNQVVRTQEAEQKLAAIQVEFDKIKFDKGARSGAPKVTQGLDAVGKILRVNPNENEVWINLGRQDHVSPGLTFAVYDPKIGASFSAENKGKHGDLEVIEVGDHESLARITHTEKNQAVLLNDAISNPVYSRDLNRKLHFVVKGDFDVDGDGATTLAEREKIVRLVQSWGGVIDDKVTSQVDFVVVGAPPSMGTVHVDTTTEQGQELLKQHQAQIKAYDETLSIAKDFSIPVLNANRFLSLIGYYNPTMVR